MLGQLKSVISWSLGILFLVWGQSGLAGDYGYFSVQDNTSKGCTIINLIIKDAKSKRGYSDPETDYGLVCFRKQSLIKGAGELVVVPYRYQSTKNVIGRPIKEWYGTGEWDSNLLQINLEDTIDDLTQFFCDNGSLNYQCDAKNKCPGDENKADCLSDPLFIKDVQLVFPNNNFHSLDQILTFIKELRKKDEKELVKSIQRSVRNNFSWKILNEVMKEEIVIDGDPGDYTKSALNAVFNEQVTNYNPERIPQDIIQKVLFGEIFKFDPETPEDDGMPEVTTGSPDANNPSVSENLTGEKNVPSPVNDEPNNQVGEKDATSEELEKSSSTSELELNSLIEDLGYEIDDLKYEIEDLQYEIEDLQKNLDKKDKWQAAVEEKTLAELLERVPLTVYFNSVGMGLWSPMRPGSIDYTGCKFSFEEFQNLNLANLKIHMHKIGCVKYVFPSNLERDAKTDVRIDKTNLYVTVVEKQHNKIRSIKSEPINNLKLLAENGGMNDCYVELEPYKNKELQKFKGGNIKIYGYQTAGGATFEADKKLEGRNIFWENLEFKLVEQSDSTGQKCEVTSEDFIPIVRAGDEVTSPDKAIAVISREGDITLKNVQILQKAGKTLVVFVDEKVGPKDSENYAFNGSLTTLDKQIVQEEYYKGFILGLKSYLETTKEVEFVQFFNSFEDDQVPIITGQKGEDGKFDRTLFNQLNEYATETFKPGQQGPFTDKKTLHKNLVENNKTTFFVFFGSTGEISPAACGEKMGISSAGTITFDIWPTYVRQDLLNAELIKKLEKGVLYECVDDPSIAGFNWDSEAVSTKIAGYITKILKDRVEQ